MSDSPFDKVAQAAPLAAIQQLRITTVGAPLFWIKTQEKMEVAVIRTMLQAKLHRARVTQACLDYEGSCGIDEQLLELSGILPNQYIEIYNVTNGERFCTYAIRGKRGSGDITLNGAAARKAAIGDTLIICAYSTYTEAEIAAYEPIVVLMDENNQAREVLRSSGESQQQPVTV